MSTIKDEVTMKKASSSDKLTEEFKQLDIMNPPQSIKLQKRSRSQSGDASDEVVKKLSRSTSGNENSEDDKCPVTVISSTDRMMELPSSPTDGTLGDKTDIRVNCFRVNCRTEHITQYIIEFDPPLPDDSTIRKQSIIYKKFDQIRNYFGVFIFDNTRLWSMKKITEEVNIPDDEHSIRIIYCKSVELRNAPFDEFNQIIHIIFQKAASNANLVKIGRNYYDKNTLNSDKFLLIRDRLRLFRGYMMSIAQTRLGLVIFIDISHRVISTDSVAGMIDSKEDMLSGTRGGGYDTRRGPNRDRGDRSQYRGTSRTSSRDSYGTSSGNDDRVRNNSEELMRLVEEELIGRCVITTYRMRNWRIDGIDWKQNIDSKFTWRKKNGETVEISYRDYFMENYRLRLTNTRNGLLVNMPKGRRSKGPDRFLLPPEACYMTGLSKKMKADFRLMKRIRDVVSLNPRERFKGISDIVKHISRSLEETSSSDDRSESSEERSNYLRIDIEPNPISLQARVLKDVMTQVKVNNDHSDVKAKDLMRHWARSGYVNQKQHVVRKWVVFHEGPDRRNAVQLVDKFMSAASQYKLLKHPIDMIQVKVNPRSPSVFDRWKDTIEDVVSQINGLDLIVAVIPSHFNSDLVYSAVKTATLMSNTRLIPSQCIKAQRFDPRKSNALRSVISSSLKQVLTKRGNVPWIVKYKIQGRFNPFNKSTMICGIDVNHDKKRNRSTAGFCVSGDSRFSRYDTYVSISSAGRESIQGAEKCMVKSLLSFHKDNGKLPDHVVVYRDGVSNSELVKVLNTEVKSFRNAFKHEEVLKKATPGYDPKLTFVVVQKTVSLRIFNRALESGVPGTVVDKDITSSRFWNFYMLTTKPPPGKTSRPTCYTVIHDDYGIQNNELQAFTHQLCHTYYNFPGPIRVPAPVQIAHQVAYLFGSIISEQKESLVFTPKCKGKAYYL